MGCPQECAGQSKTQIKAQDEIEIPADIWQNLTSKQYKIWRCDYCGFVWGELFYNGEPAPRYWRSAVGYFGGREGQAGWLFTPDLNLPDYPDVTKMAKKMRH